MATYVRACVACCLIQGGRALGIIGRQDGYAYRTVRVVSNTSACAAVAGIAACLSGPGKCRVDGMTARYIRGLISSRGNAVTSSTGDGRRTVWKAVKAYAGRTAVGHTLQVRSVAVLVRAGRRCSRAGAHCSDGRGRRSRTRVSACFDLMLVSGDPRGEPGTASEHDHVRQRACSPLSCLVSARCLRPCLLLPPGSGPARVTCRVGACCPVVIQPTPGGR